MGGGESALDGRFADPSLTALSAVLANTSCSGELTLTQKQTAKTGQLSKRLYHMPISFVCLESESAGPREGETTMEKKESRRRDRRLIILTRSAGCSGWAGGPHIDKPAGGYLR